MSVQISNEKKSKRSAAGDLHDAIVEDGSNIILNEVQWRVVLVQRYQRSDREIRSQILDGSEDEISNGVCRPRRRARL